MKKEIELKYQMASKEDFHLFENFLEPYRCDKKHIFLQENSYFDTPALDFRRNGISLRLRRQNQEYLLSAKSSLGKKVPPKNLSVRLEFEGKLTKRIASLIGNAHLSPVDAFSFLPAATTEEETTKKTLHRQMEKAATLGLQIIGSFSNVRINIPILLHGHKISLELDHSTYPQAVEIYEVEVEFPGIREVNALRPSIEALFRAAGLKTSRSISKSSRLYRLLFS